MRSTGEILQCESCAIEESDVSAVLSACLHARDQMAEFRIDIVLTEELLREWHVDLAAMRGLLHVINHYFRVRCEFRSEFLFASSICTDRIDVRTRLYPFPLHDRSTCRRDRGEYVSRTNSLLRGGRDSHDDA